MFHDVVDDLKIAIRAHGIGADVFMRHNRSAVGAAYDVPLDDDAADAAQINTARGKHVLDHAVLNRRARPAVLWIGVDHPEAFLQAG